MKQNDKLLKLQDSLYNLLIDFDGICKEHKLQYYLSYGTLLGAVRHGGFIPWDDDIDLTMPREDYDRLIANHKQILPSYCELQHFKHTPNYHLNFVKILNRNTTVVEEDGKDHYRIGGVFIDIYPIDGVGNDYEEALRRRRKAGLYVRLNSWASYSKTKIKTKPLYARLIIYFVQSFINGKKLKLKTERFLKEKPYANSKYVTVGVGTYNKRKVVEKEVYGLPQKIKFRDHFFDAPAMLDKYLEKEYGEDYMKLPPKEKRCSEHQLVYVDLNLPFDDFDIKKLKGRNTADEGN